MADRARSQWHRVLYAPGEGRLRAGWRLVALVALLGVGLVAAGVVSFEIVRITPARGPLAAVAVALAWLLLNLAIALAVLATVRWIDHRPWTAWLDDPEWAADLTAGLAIGIGMATAAAAAGLGAGSYRVVGTLVARADRPLLATVEGAGTLGATPPLLVVALLLVVHVGVGFSEELLVRGYLLTNLAEGVGGFGRVGPRGGIAFAAVATAALFGVLHLGNPNAGAISTLNILLAGLFFAGTYLATASLWIPIGLHVAWNFGLAGLYGLPVSGLDGGGSLLALAPVGDATVTGGGFGPEAGLVFYPALAVGVLASAAWIRYSRGELTVDAGIGVYSPPGDGSA